MQRQPLTCGEQLRPGDFARLQRTLQRRRCRCDPENIWAVGFGPKICEGKPSGQMAARFLVRRKLARPGRQRAIPETELVRLWDPSCDAYRLLEVVTDIEVERPPRPTGVAVRGRGGKATTALVIRWSQQSRPRREFLEAGQGAWRWGVLTVAHLGRETNVSIRRRVHCEGQPREVGGRMMVRGRLPGGPDVMLLETDRDWLWLSGLLPDPTTADLPAVPADDWLGWLASPTSGYLHSLHGIYRWQMSTYFPSYTIDGLGSLEEVVRFTVDPADSEHDRPLRVGTSGSILVEGGRPAAMQVAATASQYRTGYAQTLARVTGWLRERLEARHLELVHVI
jgi:hypothetical protein